LIGAAGVAGAGSGSGWVEATTRGGAGVGAATVSVGVATGVGVGVGVGAAVGVGVGAGLGAGRGAGLGEAVGGAPGAVRGSVRAGTSVAGRNGVVFPLRAGRGVKSVGTARRSTRWLWSAEAVGAIRTDPGAARC
jgi:hypothetical protein